MMFHFASRFSEKKNNKKQRPFLQLHWSVLNLTDKRLVQSHSNPSPQPFLQWNDSNSCGLLSICPLPTANQRAALKSSHCRTVLAPHICAFHKHW